MSKKITPDDPAATPETPATTDNTLALLQAQNDALASEVADLQEQLEAARDEHRELQKAFSTLLESLKTSTSSVDLQPEKPKVPERPVVEIGCERYQFKSGSFRIGRSEVFATDVAADETILAEIFSKYPGLFRKL